MFYRFCFFCFLQHSKLTIFFFLRQVEHLDLSSNLLTELTEEVNRLTDLLYLNLARNQLAFLPEDLGQLQRLRRLDLTDNNIADIADIASISQLPSLIVLYISRNPLPDLKGLTSKVLQAVDAGHCCAYYDDH